MKKDSNSASRRSRSKTKAHQVTLAIDPGTRHMGFASFENRTLEDFGVKDLRRVVGAGDLFEAVELVIGRLLQQKRPDVLVLEKNSFSQIQQNIQLTLAIGKMRQMARKRKITVAELDPRTVRKIICRNGNATKKDVAKTIAIRYPEMLAYLESNRRWRERYYQNAFDAIACGLAFIVTNGNTISSFSSRNKAQDEAAERQ